MGVTNASLAEGRPQERLRRYGASALSDAELSALIVGPGGGGESAESAAQRVLSATGGLARLTRTGLGTLSRLPGVGEARAARLVAAVELGIRGLTITGQGEPFFNSSREVWLAYRGRLQLLQQEVFYAVGLNNKNRRLSEVVVAKGSLTECLVEPREVFRPMIADAAARVVLLHNHPSGDPTPSPEDLILTRRLVASGELVGIPILDHLVFGENAYTSLRDQGFLTATV